ncbi:MAG TPA: magnesium chelatase ATPase subunit I [Pyrinomonadaceae bacterium]|jgi:magnesium chelatase subunit D
MTVRPSHKRSAKQRAARPVFPFTAIVGQEEMKLALLLNVVSPSVGGVLVTGHRGTGKSTAVRALADLLPSLNVARGCAYNCDPSDADALCEECAARLSSGAPLGRERRAVPVVELPLGATEDRVCGTIDLGRALKEGVKAFEPGLLARANRGFLYIDEVNLLEDHLVDLLLDVAATGRNRVEREGVSAEHPARFRLVGSANPEEGELRPQLLDRFGLCVEVETERDLERRVQIVEHREAFDEDPAGFNAAQEAEQTRLRRRVVRAAGRFAGVKVPRALLRRIAELCQRLGVDGHRGEITVARAARALAAFEGRGEATAADVKRVAPLALRHRLRRDPLEQGGGGARVERASEEMFGGEDSDSGEGGKARRPPVDVDERAAAGRRARAEGRGVSEDDSAPRRAAPDAEGRGEPGADERTRVVSPSEVATAPEALTPKGGESATRLRSDASPSRRRAARRGSTFSARGRYAGASSEKTGRGSVALDATLRAVAARRATDEVAAPGRSARVAPTSGVEPEALRFKRFKSRVGTLFIFLVDTSGSMAANRIAQAKGAVAQLLRRSYVNRDRVALITFREAGAELLLPPSASASRARTLLDALPVGGATPLASGLLRALEVARKTSAEGARRVRLVVFTDGRANVPLSGNNSGKTSVTVDERRGRIGVEIQTLGASLRKACVASLVVDTQHGFTADGRGRSLADALGGEYVRLPRALTESSFVN